MVLLNHIYGFQGSTSGAAALLLWSETEKAVEPIGGEVPHAPGRQDVGGAGPGEAIGACHEGHQPPFAHLGALKHTNGKRSTTTVLSRFWTSNHFKTLQRALFWSSEEANCMQDSWRNPTRPLAYASGSCVWHPYLSGGRSFGL